MTDAMASSDFDSKSVKPRDLRRIPSENVHIEFGDADRDEHDHSPRGDITACDIHLGAEGEHGELVIETVFARKEDERTIRQRIFEAWEYYHYYCIQRVFIFPQPPDADDDEEDKEEYRLDCIRVRRNRYLLAALLMLLLALLFWLNQRGDSFAATPTPNPKYPAIGLAIQLKRTTLTALPAQPMCRWPDPEAHEDVPHPLCKWLDPKAREGVEKGLLHAKKALMTSWKPLILAAVTVSAIDVLQAVAIPALGTWAGPLAASAVAEILWRVGRGVGAAKRAAEHDGF